jgi:hypothetical protein
MAVQTGGKAPYAPPSAVLEIIRRYRDAGLMTPFTPDVLMRAGVSESLAPRTLQALQLLDLVDEKSGEPTSQFEAIRRATTDDFPGTLAETLRSAYAEVFQFVDPTRDNQQRIEDAFREYQPAGQRRRMVTLFLGLCQEAGIIEDGPTARAPRPRRREGTRSQPRAGSPVSRTATGAKGRQPVTGGANGLPPALGGLLAQLPEGSQGWTQHRRDAFLRTFQAVLDFCVPIVEESEGEEV